MAIKTEKLKIAYFGGGPGSGPVFRALALWKAIQRSGMADKIDFRATVFCPGYTHLLGKWGVPCFPEHIVFQNTFPRPEQALQHLFKHFNPDVFISSYIIKHVQEQLDAMDVVSHKNDGKCKAWLLMRDVAPDTYSWLKKWDYDPTLWQGIFTIEPTAYEELKAACYPSTIKTIHPVNPVISVWPDELLPADEARAALLKLGGIRDYGRPLALVAHNGQSGQEMVKISQKLGKVLGSLKQHTQNVFLSQNHFSNGLYLEKPVALYFGGVDTLVAAPGPNMFWEWQMLAASRPNTKAAWFPQARDYDPQELRVTRYSQDGGYFAGKPFVNGADQIIARVTEGLV